MVADDVFRSRLQATIAELRYWVPTIAEAVHVEQTESHDFWKIAVTPAVAAACPFELVLRADQHYDISVAGETFEDQPIGSLDIFLPLVRAIADGRVIERRTASVATGTPLSIEIRITLDDGTVWTAGRQAGGAEPVPAVETAISDRHFLPYKR